MVGKELLLLSSFILHNDRVFSLAEIMKVKVLSNCLHRLSRLSLRLYIYAIAPYRASDDSIFFWLVLLIYGHMIKQGVKWMREKEQNTFYINFLHHPGKLIKKTC